MNFFLYIIMHSIQKCTVPAYICKVILRFQQKQCIQRISRKKIHDPLHENHKNESEKKSMNYIFQVGIDFGQTRVYSDFD